jgi:glycosyltransferase involved in cell wall biosynthesis
MVQAVVATVYGLFVVVSFLNWLLMRRPKGRGDSSGIIVLIPARDEAENLARLVPELRKQFSRVVVFDDESSDGTGDIASELGAEVIRPSEPLPEGWTGKNRGCDALGRYALETGKEPWFMFLDADVYPAADFGSKLAGMLDTSAAPVVSGIPTVAPGRGIEPLFLAWVGWILLSANPYGLVARSGMGHNRFTNGQFVAWRRETWDQVRPNEAVRRRVAEDVAIGRLLARLRIPVEVVNIASVLTVRMYEHWWETLDGMSKNSYEITGNDLGTVILAVFFIVLGWLWILWLPGLALLTLSGVFVVITARSAKWPVLFMPVVAMIAAYTILRSLWWKKTGQTVWKGRIYS